MLYTLNLHSVICHLHPNKAEKSNTQIKYTCIWVSIYLLPVYLA